MSLINGRNRALAGLRNRLRIDPRIFSVYNQTTVRPVNNYLFSLTDSVTHFSSDVATSNFISGGYAEENVLTRSLRAAYAASVSAVGITGYRRSNISSQTSRCQFSTFDGANYATSRVNEQSRVSHINDHFYTYHQRRLYYNSRHSTEYYSRHRDRHHDPEDHSNHPHLYAHSPRPLHRAPALPRSFPASAFDHLSAPAVVCGGRKTSFRDLLAHSARLAREFRKRLPRVDAEKQGRAEAEARAEQQLQDGEAAEAAEGPRIAIFGRPGTDYVAAMWAAWAAGGVAVPLCESYPPEELLYVLKDSGACLIVGPEACRPVLAPLAAEAAAAFVPSDPLEGKELEERDADEEKAGIEALKNVPFSHAAALIVYTSGTTGRPKGVVHSHIGLASQAGMLVDAWDFSPSDRVLNVLPLHHVHGIMNALLSPLSAGATVEFFPSHRFSAAAVWQRWRESYPDGRCAQPDSITFFTGVPTHYMRLLQEFDRMPLQLQRKSALAASKLRLMMSGSAACPDELMRRWHQVTGQRLLERYGMTEFAMALTNPLLGEKKSGSVGVPLRGVKVKLADTAKDLHSSSSSSSSSSTGTARAMLGHLSAPGAFSSSGSTGSSSGGRSSVVSSSGSSSNGGTWSGGWGELLVKSPGMFLRYWNRPQETAEAFDPQGWFRTGDIASVDSHGYWQIHGRASVDIIKTRGFKVSALEIESKLLEHPLISEAAVLGVPERQQGEAVAAVVVLGAAQQQHQQQGVTGESVAYTCENACPVITLDELRKWAAPRMAHYKVPSRLRVVATMPCNAMGKVNKKDLLKNLFAPMQQS